MNTPSATDTTGISRSHSFFILFRAGMIALFRNRRAMVMTFALPVILFLMGEALTAHQAGSHAAMTGGIAAFALNSGLFAIGLMSFSNDLAVARERGLYRRLICAPVPSWYLPASALAVQVPAILLQSVLVIALAIGYGARSSAAGLLLIVPEVLLIGLMALACGQLLAGLIRSAAGVHAASRLLFFGLVFFMEGSYGGMKFWPAWLREISRWLPVQLSMDMLTGGITGHVNVQLLMHAGIILAYAIVLAAIGMRYFQWQAN